MDRNDNSRHTKCDRQLGKPNPNSDCVAYGIDRYAWNQGYNAKYDFQVFENEEPALVARGGQPYVAGSPWLIYQDKIGALCATDHKWCQNQQVAENKLILQKRME